MLVNIKKFQKKNGKMKSEHKVKARLQELLLDPEYGESEFIERFYKLTQIYNWKWNDQNITYGMIIEDIVSKMYKVIKAEIYYYNTHGKWRSEGWVTPHISSRRIVVIPTDFDANRHQVWMEIEVLTTL